MIRLSHRRDGPFLTFASLSQLGILSARPAERPTDRTRLSADHWLDRSLARNGARDGGRGWSEWGSWQRQHVPERHPTEHELATMANPGLKARIPDRQPLARGRR